MVKNIKGFEITQITKDMGGPKLTNVGRVKEAMAGSMLKNPKTWLGATVGLGLAKFALAGWAIGKVSKSKKKEQPKKYMAG